jgi:hypothetical protein
VRWQSGGEGVAAVAGVGEERAPVSDEAVLWLEAEAREVVAARCPSREGNRGAGETELGRRRRGRDDVGRRG